MKPAIALIALCTIITCTVRADDSVFDPKARATLDEMVKAYRSVRTLDQETSYSGAGAIVKSHLVVQRPNKLLLEIWESRAERPQPVMRRILSDGKDLYYYSDFDNNYSKQKAPRDLSGFRDMAISAELAALAGADPFELLSKRTRSAKMEEPVDIDGTMTDVVAIDISEEQRTVIARLFIGQSDHLIRRFSFDSKPIPSAKPKTPDPPPLDENGFPLETLADPLPIQLGYENKVQLNKETPKDSFKWLAPPGAMQRMDDPNGYLNQDRKGRDKLIIAQPTDLSKPTRPKDLSKPTKHTHAKDLIEKATKRK